MHYLIVSKLNIFDLRIIKINLQENRRLLFLKDRMFFERTKIPCLEVHKIINVLLKTAIKYLRMFILIPLSI